MNETTPAQAKVAVQTFLHGYGLHVLGGLVLLLGLTGWWVSCERSRVDRLQGELDQKAEAVDQLLDKNKELTDNLNRVITETDAAISRANDRIEELRRSVDASARRERQLASQLTQIQTRYAQQIGSVSSETDRALSDSTSLLLTTTSDRPVRIVSTSTGEFVTDRAGVEAIKVALLRFAESQESLQVKDSQLREKDVQIEGLNDQIAQHIEKYAQLETRLEAVELKLDNQEALLKQRAEQVDLLLEQNKALKRELRLYKVGGITVTAAAIVAAVLIR